MSTPYKIVSMNFHFTTFNKDFQNTNGICTICMKQLANVSPKDYIIVGSCHHAFHNSCYTNIKDKCCPIDKTDIEQDHYSVYDK